MSSTKSTTAKLLLEWVKDCRLPPLNPRAPRYVFIVEHRPCCPACGSERVTPYSSRKESDGTRWRHTRCRDCWHKFVVVVERTEFHPKIG